MGDGIAAAAAAVAAAGGPLNVLTYWGLADPAYRNSSIVTTARKALVRQMREMMLAVWRESHHVCENYSPWKQETAACTRLTVANLRPICALASC